MRIGTPKEIKDNENRVGITPAGVKALRAAGAVKPGVRFMVALPSPYNVISWGIAQESRVAVEIAYEARVLEELAEISTWAQLGQHQKPIILCNVEGYWNPLVTLFDHMRAERFIREGLEFGMDVVKQAEDVVPAFEHRLKTTPELVPDQPLLNKM